MSAAIWKLGTANAFSTTLNGGITDTDSSIILTTTTGLQSPGIICIDRQDANNANTPTLREYVSYTGISSNTLTGCSRGLGGSTAQTHNSGAKVEEIWSVSHWNDFVDAWLTSHNADGTQKVSVETASDGATVTFDLTAGNVHEVTLGGNRILAVSGAVTGQLFVVRLIQDGTGGRTVTWWDGISWENGGTAPTLTTTLNKTDVFVFLCTGTNTYDGFTVGQNL